MNTLLNDHHIEHMHWLDQQGDWMQARLKELVAINSGSYHLAGLQRMASAITPLFQSLNADQHIEHALTPLQTLTKRGTIEQQALGKVLTWKKRPDAPVQVLLVGHYDTVFAQDSAFQTAHMVDHNTLNGPGAADLKGGLLVMLMALHTLERSQSKARVGWTVVLNPDEEIGSPGSAPLLAEAAKHHHLGLCYEPCLPNGNLVGARKGSGNFSIHVQGRAAHAGRDHAAGRNAIVVLSEIVHTLDALNGQHGDMTVNVGAIDGGGSVNVVPEHCLMRVNVRVSNNAQIQAFEQALQAAVERSNAREGYSVKAMGGFHRPPKVMTPAYEKLLSMLRECGAAMNLDLRWQATGGCCDGNNLAAAGLPNVDNLGVRGDFIHSDKEYCLLDSLTERAKLSALLLLHLADGQADMRLFSRQSAP